MERKWKRIWRKASTASLIMFSALVLFGCSTAESEQESLQEEQQEEQVAVEKDEKAKTASSERTHKSDGETKEAGKEGQEAVGNSSSTPTQAIQTTEVQVVNDNVPYFSNEDITQTTAYHENGELDDFKRVTAANAVVGVEIMPASGTRGDISGVSPTGWNQARYPGIGSGGWLYNRSHLIGHQMTGNDSPRNLMTGTRWLNMEMLEYENYVADYVERTENHVRYRVTPVFEGSNMLASGVYMEAFSIEDNGAGVMFNIYIPNVQPGIDINYADGSSVGPEGPVEAKDAEPVVPYTPPTDSGQGDDGAQYVDENGNGLIKGSSSNIYHLPGGTHYDRTTNVKQWFKTIEEAEAAGFRPSKN